MAVGSSKLRLSKEHPQAQGNQAESTQLTEHMKLMEMCFKMGQTAAATVSSSAPPSAPSSRPSQPEFKQPLAIEDAPRSFPAAAPEKTEDFF